MNNYTQNLLTVFLVYSVVAGVVLLLLSLLFRLFSKKKITLLMCFMRFAKGFFSVLLVEVYAIADIMFDFFPTAKPGDSIFKMLWALLMALVQLAIPICIVVLVHKVTKKIENRGAQQ